MKNINYINNNKDIIIINNNFIKITTIKQTNSHDNTNNKDKQEQ